MEQLIKKMAQDGVWREWVALNSPREAGKDGCISATKSGCISATSAAPKTGCIS